MQKTGNISCIWKHRTRSITKKATRITLPIHSSCLKPTTSPFSCLWDKYIGRAQTCHVLHLCTAVGRDGCCQSPGATMLQITEALPELRSEHMLEHVVPQDLDSLVSRPYQRELSSPEKLCASFFSSYRSLEDYSKAVPRNQNTAGAQYLALGVAQITASLFLCQYLFEGNVQQKSDTSCILNPRALCKQARPREICMFLLET